MTLTEFPLSGALSRAAERWQRILIPAGVSCDPQLTDLAIRRQSDTHLSRAMPSPFRPRRAS